MSTSEYFLQALTDYMREKSVTQKVLSIDTGIPRSRISEIVNGKHAPGLRVQERIAISAGYELCDFLARGRSLLSGDAPPPVELPPNQHVYSLRNCIIQEFQDQETAKNINSMLLELEKEDVEKFRQAETYITALFDTVKIQKKTRSNS